MGNIIIKEDVTPKPVPVNLVEEAVVLPGKPLTYDDLTPEQIEELQRPAIEAAETANEAAKNADTATEKANIAAQSATTATTNANNAASEATTAALLANEATDNANSAALDATNAANGANEAITSIGTLEAQIENKESEREASETLRKEAETQRVEAETSRQQKFSQIETTVNSLVEETTTAKDDATKAATSANEAAGKANTATTSANNAAKSANAAADKANQAAQNVDGRVTALEEKASQTYENLAAIEASGETNPNKIYIDGETMQPYIYKGGSYVPFSGQEDGTISIQRCIDLSEFGSIVTGVYRFDDTGYYIITKNNFTKTDLYFKKIYTSNIYNLSDRIESGVMRDVLCKIGNKIFLAVSNFSKIVYMYDEETSEGKYLDNPEGLLYYGAVYAYDNKVYYFHRYDKPHIYVYDADGNLVTNKAYDYDYIKITDGIAFTRDGYKVNLEDLTFEKLTFPNLEEIKNLRYVFSNGNMICNVSNISNRNNTTSYNFEDIGVNEYGYCINVDDRLTVGFTDNGKYVFRYPYGILNPTFRGVDADVVSQGNIRRQTNYKNFVYSTTKGNVLIIEDVSRYDTN